LIKKTEVKISRYGPFKRILSKCSELMSAVLEVTFGWY
jgi:hypothetical protein